MDVANEKTVPPAALESVHGVDKNLPIFIAASICALIISIAALISCSLFVELHHMDETLKQEMAAFKVLLNSSFHQTKELKRGKHWGKLLALSGLL